MLDTLGIARAVLVQPSVYGTHNTVMLEAMKTDPARLRGVAVVADDIPDAELKKLDAAGVRGVRVNIVDVKDRKPGTLPLDALKTLARRVQPLGWHMEFLMHVDEFPELDRMFAGFPVDIVLGHLGYMHTDKGSNAPGFQALLRLVKSGRCWVKFTGPYRISTVALPHPDVTPFAHVLIAGNPERILWGSDWPHVMAKGAMPNDGDLADLLSDWIPDARLREQVLVKNPERLYGF
jgi:predicted TIM-barrel fold metal-dependent hydrolase